MKIKYAGLNKNDAANGINFSVSLFTQGCPHKCPGCHNPETWADDGGIEIDREELISEIINSISANGVVRNFSILGGEPFTDNNFYNITYPIVKQIRKHYPNIIICIWSGYTIEELYNKYKKDKDTLDELLKSINFLIDGRYEQDKRDITLQLRGSSNQRILFLDKDKEIMKVVTDINSIV